MKENKPKYPFRKKERKKLSWDKAVTVILHNSSCHFLSSWLPLGLHLPMKK